MLYRFVWLCMAVLCGCVWLCVDVLCVDVMCVDVSGCVLMCCVPTQDLWIILFTAAKVMKSHNLNACNIILLSSL